uniref:Uncharacterized protein n=1 Tax=Schistocephalus solidus TaxID=70667 RepID=A0A0X3Q646_SCHSO
MDAPECKPMLGNFVSVIDDSGRGEGKDATKSNGGVLKPSETYRPLHLNPVFYDQDPSAINKRRSREKVRAAKLLLEDSNINEDEDLPLEVYVRGGKLYALASDETGTSSGKANVKG